MTKLNQLSNYCPPGSTPQPGRVIDYLRELLKLSTAELRGVAVGLQSTLSVATTQATDLYRVPADQDLVVFSMHGFHRSTLWNTEPVVAAVAIDPSERHIVKMTNCLIKLENTDRNLQVFDARDLPLGAFAPPIGAPLYFPVEAPYLAPAGHTLKATFSLQDTTAAVVGNPSVYGIMLTGILIPKRQS